MFLQLAIELLVVFAYQIKHFRHLSFPPFQKNILAVFLINNNAQKYPPLVEIQNKEAPRSSLSSV